MSLVIREPVDIAPEDPGSELAELLLASYIQELNVRFPGGFERAQGIDASHDEYRMPRGVLPVVRFGARAVGCGALRKLDAGVAEVKRMWLDQSARGLGLDTP